MSASTTYNCRLLVTRIPRMDTLVTQFHHNLPKDKLIGVPPKIAYLIVKELSWYNALMISIVVDPW